MQSDLSFINLALGQLVDGYDRYNCRATHELEPDGLRSLMDRLRIDGQLTPVKVYEHDLGKFTLVAGHRRVAALLHLAKSGEPGFSLDRPVQAILIK